MSDTTFLPVGTLLARQYKILEYIGAGGFGKTYLVEDQFGAKKVVKEFFISSMCTRDAATRSVTVSVGENKEVFQQQLEKFKEEARRIYSLSHPNIVKVSALFDENDTAYYVMDYVDGESLAQKSKRTTLTEQQIMRYLDQLLSALEYIHSQGITHLDIKPGNIMIDKNDNVVLIDFGASKLFNTQSVNKTMMTSMRPPFTPGYAPLEQENGNVKDMGPHCDIYALGATLYYLYTGDKPASPFEIFQNGLPSISKASSMMQKVIKGALEFDKRNRIKTVAEFRAVLAGDVASIGTQKYPESDETKIAAVEEVEVENSPVGEATRMQPQQPANIDIPEPEQIKRTEKTQIVSPTSFQTSSKSTSSNSPKKIRSWAAVVIGLIIVIGIGGALLMDTGASTVASSSDAIAVQSEIETISVNGVSFDMVKVEGGTFKMGAQSTDPNGENYDSEADSDEQPIHSVTLGDYYIGETEVTQELWEAVMGSNPSYFNGSNKPVEDVSWDDCQEFIAKLNQLTGKSFRLPTEAEWEYAARGGNKSRVYKYSGSNNIDEVAWYYDNACDGVEESSPDYGTHPVGTKLPNELGIYDMSGNVWEWCSDWYGDYSSSTQTNPTGPNTGSYRVLRGGSWCSNASRCRVAFRSSLSPGNRSYDFGFRLALSL